MKHIHPEYKVLAACLRWNKMSKIEKVFRSSVRCCYAACFSRCMIRIRSSWNPDRIAASACNRRPAKKQGPRPSALYAQYKVNTDIVTVFTRRGSEL